MKSPVWNEITGPLATCGHHVTRVVGTNDLGEPVDFLNDYQHPGTGEMICRECYAEIMEARTRPMTAADMVHAFSGGAINL